MGFIIVFLLIDYRPPYYAQIDSLLHSLIFPYHLVNNLCLYYKDCIKMLESLLFYGRGLSSSASINGYRLGGNVDWLLVIIKAVKGIENCPV